MRYLNTLTRMKSVKLNRLENLNVADALYFSFYEIAVNKKDIISSLLRLLVYLFTIDVQYSKHGNYDIAFVYTNSYKNRSDQYAVFQALNSLFYSKVLFKPGFRKLCLKNLKFLPELTSWYWEFQKFFSIKEAVYYSSMMLFGVVNAEYISRRIERMNCKSVVVMSDMHLIDSLLVQLCNRKNITTITLQHGNFELDEPFVLSKSKFFLTYGDYSRNKAISYGVNPDKLVKAGLLKAIGKSLPNKMAKKTDKIKTIGVILSGGLLCDSDTKMVNFISKYCKNNNKNLFVKFHPGYGIENYKDVNWNFVKKAFNSEISIEIFQKQIDVAIVFNSTVFFEYVLDLFPTLVFVDEIDNFVPEIKWCKFSTYSKLDSLIQMLQMNHDIFEIKLKKLRKYFSEPEDVDLSYKNVISDISGLTD